MKNKKEKTDQEKNMTIRKEKDVQGKATQQILH